MVKDFYPVNKGCRAGQKWAKSILELQYLENHPTIFAVIEYVGLVGTTSLSLPPRVVKEHPVSEQVKISW